MKPTWWRLVWWRAARMSRPKDVVSPGKILPYRIWGWKVARRDTVRGNRATMANRGWMNGTLWRCNKTMHCLKSHGFWHF